MTEMNELMRYVLISTFCLSILYLGYLQFSKNVTRLHQLRYFLLISIVLSVVMPFTTFRINIDLLLEKQNTAEIIHESVTDPVQAYEPDTNLMYTAPEDNHNIDFMSVLVFIYFFGFLFLILRIVIHLIKIFYLRYTSGKIKQGNVIILSSEKIKSPFTFFIWIFIPDNTLTEKENNDILNHERIHASQYHSIDLILIELLSAVMWFNPLVWMMKNSVQLVHEYLADEGVLNTGTDKLRYQALLINQLAEGRLICLSSGLNHSLIKKRMIMMTKSKFNQGSKLRIFTLIPLATVLLFAIACVNGQYKSDVVTAVEPVRMNVLYIGVDNPVKIAASGYNPSDLSVSVDNGMIEGKNGEYIIRPKQVGSAVVSVSNNGKDIQKTTFRVKRVPDPVAKVDRMKGGNATKAELLKAEQLTAEMEYFDFDLNFDIVEFSVSTTIKGKVSQEKSTSGKITSKQKELISKAEIGNPVYFQDIQCKGPDGTVRKMPPVLFKLTE